MLITSSSMLARRLRALSGLALLAALSPGCAGSPPGTTALGGARPLFPRAWVIREDADLAAACEERLARSYETPPAPGEPWLRELPGRSRVLVTAPHATAQTREGETKSADGGTGSLAVMLNALAGTPVLYTTRLSPSDPNYYDDNEFKRTLGRLLDEHRPRVVLDLHASHTSRPYDVDLGTMGGTSLGSSPELLPRLAAALRAEGLANFSQDYFPAARNRTVTRFVAARGVPVVQLEINGTWLLRAGAPDVPRQRFAQILQGLVRFAASVDGRELPERRGVPSADPGDPCGISAAAAAR
jgi:hypothetical protein